MRKSNWTNLPKAKKYLKIKLEYFMTDRILRQQEVRQLIGNPSRATLYRWIQRGEFPPPVTLGGGSVGWRESVVQSWIEDRPKADVTKR